MENEWKLVGFDTFEEEYYPLAGNFPNEKEARKASSLRFKQLELTQPTESSGGQDDLGIQDRIFIRRPDGSLYRFIPLPEEFSEQPK